MFKIIKPSLLMLLFFTVLTGAIYPMAVWVTTQSLFFWQANGSLLVEGKTVLGSELIGQNFTNPDYFWGRPSATSTSPYNGSASGGSNLGPTNPALTETILARIKTLRDAETQHELTIPVDLVTTSASGLDPHISPAAAMFQASRVSAARKLSIQQVQELVSRFTEPRQWFILGEPRVNVLKLNLALDNRPVTPIQ